MNFISKENLKYRSGNLRMHYDPATNRYINRNNLTESQSLIQAGGKEYFYNPKTDRFEKPTTELKTIKKRILSNNYVFNPFTRGFTKTNSGAYKRLIKRVRKTPENQINNNWAETELRERIKKEDELERLNRYIHTHQKDLSGLVVRMENYFFENINGFTDYPSFQESINARIQSLLQFIPTENVKYAICIHYNDIRENGAVRQSDYKTDIQDAIKQIIDKFVENEERYEDDRTFEIIGFSLSIIHIRPDSERGRGSSKNLNIAKRTWKVTSFKSSTNCFFQNIAFLDGILDDKKRVNAAKNMKLKNGFSGIGSIGYEEVKKFSQIRNAHIIVYDNNYGVMWDVEPENLKDAFGRTTTKKCRRYEMQLRNGHYLALQRWNDINEKYEEKKYEEAENVKGVDEEIVKRNFKKITLPNGKVIYEKIKYEKDHKFVTWDIEATTYSNQEDIINASVLGRKTKSFTPFLCGFSHYKDFKEDGPVVFKQFKGIDCIKQMFNYVHLNRSTYKDTTWYSHCGGSFDLPIALKHGLLDDKKFYINGEKCIELNNSWINFSLLWKIENDKGKFKKDKSKSSSKITFKDSYSVLPASLKSLCKSFKIKVGKMDLDHDKVTLENWEDYYTKNNGFKYHEVDCTSLLEIIKKFNKVIYDKAGINLTSCMTGSSLAKKAFFKNFYKKLDAVYKLSKEHDEYVRKSFFGGRCEAFQLGKLPSEKLYYYDFTSLHPWSGTFDLPTGVTIEHDYASINNFRKNDPKLHKFFGFIECIVKTRKFNKLPLHGHRVDGKLVFSHHKEGTRMILTSAEIQTGLAKNLYDYEFLSGCQYKPKPIMAEFFKSYFEMKKQAGLEGHVALKYALKIIINSAYGFWSINTKNRDCLSIHDNLKSMDCMMSEERVKNWGTIGSKNFVRGTGDIPVEDFNAGISSFISSYSRIKLWELMNNINKRGGKVFYCDTDSVITNYNLRSDKDMMKKYCPDGSGLELGSLKNECLELVENHFYSKYDEITAKEKIHEQLLKDGGEFCFDSGVILGCKFYALKKKLIDGEEKVILKLKGYNQKADKLYGNTPLTYDKFEKLGNELKTKGILPVYNFGISQIQKQWLRPKTNFTSERNHLEIQLKSIAKKFNPIYTKGQVDNETLKINPLIL